MTSASPERRPDAPTHRVAVSQRVSWLFGRAARVLQGTIVFAPHFAELLGDEPPFQLPEDRPRELIIESKVCDRVCVSFRSPKVANCRRAIASCSRSASKRSKRRRRCRATAMRCEWRAATAQAARNRRRATAAAFCCPPTFVIYKPIFDLNSRHRRCVATRRCPNVNGRTTRPIAALSD